MKASPASSSVRSHDRSSIAGKDGKVGRTMGAFTVVSPSPWPEDLSRVREPDHDGGDPPNPPLRANGDPISPYPYQVPRRRLTPSPPPRTPAPPRACRCASPAAAPRAASSRTPACAPSDRGWPRSPVRPRADEPPEALLERHRRLRHAVGEEGVLPLLLQRAAAGGDHRVGGQREGELVDDHQAERLAGHVDALPEAHGGDEHGVALARNGGGASASGRRPGPAEAGLAAQRGGEARMARLDVQRTKAPPPVKARAPRRDRRRGGRRRRR